MKSIDLGGLLRPADMVLIVPPFAGIDRPSLGVHLLQAVGKSQGIQVRVFYANLHLAMTIGEVLYESICYAASTHLLGERFFAEAAWGTPAMAKWDPDYEPRIKTRFTGPPLDPAAYQKAATQAAGWVREMAEALACPDFPVVGASSCFEQTAASLAILKAIKTARPETLIILGGANCEAEMAEGIARFCPELDYVFSGESEISFSTFLAGFKDNNLPDDKIIGGLPCERLDALPHLDYADYYEQADVFLRDGILMKSGNIWLAYEASRGCWWGEKRQCLFCGVNGQFLHYRMKTPSRALSELDLLLKSHPTRLVCMTDNVMPREYFDTVLPQLAQASPALHIFYEQRSSLSREQVQLLKNAGVGIIQPGIEALSTPLLKLMKKGVAAGQNLALLRYARSVELAVNWNLLYAFPHDKIKWYQQTMELIPLIVHLHPPTGVQHLSIDRFSPYFNDRKQFGITNLRPMEAYFEVFPEDAPIDLLAYHFEADYESESGQDDTSIPGLQEAVHQWREIWQNETSFLPALTICAGPENSFLLADTRGVPGTTQFQFITRDQAQTALIGSRTNDGSVEWALENKVAVLLDGKIVPLATAGPELFAFFESPETIGRKNRKSL